MKYYAFIENNKIDGCGQCRCLNEEIQNIEVSEEVFNNIEKYIWDGEAIILNPEWDTIVLNKAKEEKAAENDEVRDTVLMSGVTYKSVLFDSDTDQKVNLLATVSMMGDEDTIAWFGMDNTPLECTKEDLLNIGVLITALHTFCWTKNAEIKAEISQAQTIEEVEAICIDYSMPINEPEESEEEPEGETVESTEEKTPEEEEE